MPKKSPNKNLALYNKLQREFKKLNDKLPEYQRLSVKTRRDIISKTIFPFLKDKKQVGVKDLRNRIQTQIDLSNQSITQDDCNPLLIDPSVLVDIEWMDLDAFIRDILPNCIYVQVEANGFGTTKIFNTRNYSYYSSGIKQITEKIRQEVNNDSGMGYDYTGYVQVRPNKKDDGKGDSYYVKIVLNENGKSVEDIDIIAYKVPKEKKNKSKQILNEIIERKKQLVGTKRKTKKANETTKKNIQKVKSTKDKINKTRSSKQKTILLNDLIKEYNKSMRALNDGYKKGYFSKSQYSALKKQLDKNFNLAKGGLI
jgi:hypothetical protein